MNLIAAYNSYFSEIEGWFDKSAAATWDVLLNYQKKNGIRGDLLEIGVWKGKSAGLAALHCREGECCIFIDVLPMDDVKELIHKCRPEIKCHYLKTKSCFLLKEPIIKNSMQKCRWLHIDGEHTGHAVQNDLDICDQLLCENGVISIDDFFSAAYPQITQAVFQFLHTRPGRLSLILCGFDKGYLCRPKAAKDYLAFIKSNFYREMKIRGCGRITIWKTTEPNDMNTFGITSMVGERNFRGPDWDSKNIYI